MAEHREKTQDDLPVYLARPTSTNQRVRQKFGGMFCSVRDAFEGKTLDFDSLSVGQKRTPRASISIGTDVGSQDEPANKETETLQSPQFEKLSKTFVITPG
ncbi:uncharacterized protein LOC144212215 isoform X2 [Stigmatopora nigra]